MFFRFIQPWLVDLDAEAIELDLMLPIVADWYRLRTLGDGARQRGTTLLRKRVSVRPAPSAVVQGAPRAAGHRRGSG